MRFGRHLLNQRKKNKLSAEDLSLSCGISRSYITLIENGKRLPSARVISKIAKGLKIKTNSVLNWYLEDLREKMQKRMKG